MKKLLSLSSDFIIHSDFKPKHIDNKYDFIDDTNTKVNGKYHTRSVSFFVQTHDQYGNPSGNFIQAWLTKDDIINLYTAIELIHESEGVDLIEDDLPF